MGLVDVLTGATVCYTTDDHRASVGGFLPQQKSSHRG
jgi:hypothetical protein